MRLGLKTSAIFLIVSAFTGSAASKIIPPARRDDYTEDSSNKVAATWFAGWHENQFSSSDVPWEKYTHAFYAFTTPTPDPAKLDESDLKGLPAFVSQAREHCVKPLVSVGGFSGSGFFSTAVGSAPNRTAFVKAVTNLAVKYGVDGVDFDWEYPTSPGIGCNTHNINDTANFLLFLQELRAHPVGSTLVITAAVGPMPWLAPEGTPVQDVSGFANILNFTAIMLYDIWGPWSQTVGPNAPLNDTCAPGAAQMGSAVSAVQAWKKAGMPADKLVLGIPAYGHSYRVHKQDAFVKGSTTELALYPPFDANSPPTGTKWDSLPGEVDICGVTSKTPGGIIQYWGMMTLGYLDHQGNPKSGQIYNFDNCTKTPYIYDQEKEIMVSYDDPQSMRAKGQFIKSQNLRGFSMWEAGGDYHCSLLDAIRSEF